MAYNGYDRNTQDGMFDWQDAWRLRRDHRLGLIRRIARHRAAALHRLLVSRHWGEAVGKLQNEQCSQPQNQKCHPANHLIKL